MPYSRITRVLATTTLAVGFAAVLAPGAGAEQRRPPVRTTDPDAVALQARDAVTGYQSGDPSSSSPVVVPPVAIDVDAHGYGATNSPPQGNFDNMNGYDSGEDGCDIDCITSALTYPTDDPTVTEAEIATTVPARIDLWLPIGVLGRPADSLDDADIVASSNAYQTFTELELTGLEPGTTRTLAVRATDENGDQWWEVGSFEVPDVPDLLITIESIQLLHDGDTNDGNPGELQFFWGFGSHVSGWSAEIEAHDGAFFAVDGDNTLVVADAWGPLPGARVDAREDDPDDDPGWLIDSCPATEDPGLFPAELWGSVDCSNTQWNGAAAGIHTPATIGAFPLCTVEQVDQPAADLHCEQIETQDHGGEYPRFRVVVTYQFVS